MVGLQDYVKNIKNKNLINYKIDFGKNILTSDGFLLTRGSDCVIDDHVVFDRFNNVNDGINNDFQIENSNINGRTANGK